MTVEVRVLMQVKDHQAHEVAVIHLADPQRLDADMAFILREIADEFARAEADG